MAIVKLQGSGGEGIDFRDFDVSDLFEYKFSTRTTTTLRVYDDADDFARFSGAGLTYKVVAGKLADITGGTFNSIRIVDSGVAEMSFSDFSRSAVKLYDFYQKDDSVGALNFLLSGNDTITGTDRADHILGKNGADAIAGMGGRDFIDGGNGNDRLHGGGGPDVLKGGAGSDDFVFKHLRDSRAGAANQDAILDFSTVEHDQIDLHKIGQGLVFTFIGHDSFSGAAAEVRYVSRGGDTFVYADADGDRAADMAIRLDGSLTLRGADFIL